MRLYLASESGYEYAYLSCEACDEPLIENKARVYEAESFTLTELLHTICDHQCKGKDQNNG